MRKWYFIVLILCFCFEQTLNAESKSSDASSLSPKKKSTKRTRGFFGTIGFLLNDLDTNYVEPNHYNFTLMLEHSIWHENYRLSNDNRGMSFTPTTSYKLGPYVGWSFIFLGWTIDVGALLNKTRTDKRTEFSLNLYSSIVGGDLYFRKSNDAFRLHSLDGFGDAVHDFDGKVDGFSVDIKGVNVYYVFNHRRFSYPAAYSQSTNQIRSAGSLIAGFSYSNHRLKLSAEDLPSMIKDSLIGNSLNFNEVYYSDYSVSLGYAYNWVFARNCLFNISFSPALAFKQSHLENEEVKLPTYRKLNLDFISRVGVTWNNGRYYFGASWVYNNFDYRTNTYNIQNGFGIARFYAGFNFGLKKKYKTK